jgi:hypothetical protein
MLMKKLLIITISFLALSCNKSIENSQEVANLLNRISHLEAQNKMLQDIIERNEQEFLTSQILIGISDNPILKVGKKNNIVMLLQTFGRKLPKYEIFKIDDGKEIKVGENDGTRFNYEFIPTSIIDNSPELLVKIPSNGKIITIPSKLFLNVQN